MGAQRINWEEGDVFGVQGQEGHDRVIGVMEQALLAERAKGSPHPLESLEEGA